MSLIKVRRLAYEHPYTYAPPQEDALINPDEVSAVLRAEARGCGPFVRLEFRNGTSMTVAGAIDDFLPPETGRGGEGPFPTEAT